MEDSSTKIKIILFSLLIIFQFGIIYTLFFWKNYNSPNEKNRKKPVPTTIVFGSGGHTAEMYRLVKNLPKNRYSPRFYVIAKDDLMSEKKMKELENNSKDAILIKVPRSRKVQQSYLTSVFTTLYSLLYCIYHNFKNKPELIICNGPSTCVPIAYSAFFLSWLMPWRSNGRGNLKVIYVESLARVKSLSLSGKLIYPIANKFIVQWPELYTKLTHRKVNPSNNHNNISNSNSNHDDHPEDDFSDDNDDFLLNTKIELQNHLM